MNRHYPYVLALATLLSGLPGNIVAQDTEASLRDSTQLCIDAVMLADADTIVRFESLASYALICRTQNSYEEVFIPGREFQSQAFQGSSLALGSRTGIDSLLAGKLSQHLYLMNPESSTIQSRGRGRYLIIDDRMIFQHGGQTSWGTEVTLYFERTGD